MSIPRILWLLAFAPQVARADITFTDYHSPTQVETELSALAAAYPGLAELRTLGTTAEGRPIRALKIAKNPSVDDAGKGKVIFVSAIHACEWLGVEMGLYLAQYLLQHYATDARLRADVDALSIWVVPISNPDGVAYTWSSYRYWRKNRVDNGDGSFGVDLNRNWGYRWGLDSGSSPNPWDITYRGPIAFSEPETRAIRDLALGPGPLRGFLSFHTYSELFLRPWSHTFDDPPGEPTLASHSDRGVARIAAVHGETYAPSIWYTSSGDATDWFWGEARAAAFTTEGRPNCGYPSSCGLSGFSPPATTILPYVEENLPVALAIIHDAAAREVWISDYPGDGGNEPSAVWTANGWSHEFWLSPDIWTVPAELTEGAVVSLNVRVHNASGRPKPNVQIEAYYTDPRITLEFPSLASVSIGAQTVTLPPGDRTVTFSWTVPTGTNSWGERHWCVGAVVKQDDDLPLTTHAERSSNVAIRNFETKEMALGQTLFFAATNVLGVPAELHVHIDREKLPRGWKVVMPPRPEPPRTAAHAATLRKAKLLGAKGILLEPGETIMLPVRVEAERGVRERGAGELTLHGALLPLSPGRRAAVGNGFTYRIVAGREGEPRPR